MWLSDYVATLETHGCASSVIEQLFFRRDVTSGMFQQSVYKEHL